MVYQPIKLIVSTYTVNIQTELRSTHTWLYTSDQCTKQHACSTRSISGHALASIPLQV